MGWQCITERYEKLPVSIRKPQVARSIRVAGSTAPAVISSSSVSMPGTLEVLAMA